MSGKILEKYRFATYVGITFSAMLLVVSLIGLFLGDEAAEYSKLYRLGSEGMAYESIGQLLLCSILLTVLRWFFMVSQLMERVPPIWRFIGMTISTVALIVLFILCFGWFPIGLGKAWIGFIISFGICFVVSIILTTIKTKLEQKKYDRLLEDYKRRRTQAEKETNNKSRGKE